MNILWKKESQQTLFFQIFFQIIQFHDRYTLSTVFALHRNNLSRVQKIICVNQKIMRYSLFYFSVPSCTTLR